MKLNDIIVRDAVVAQLASAERDEVISEMVDALVAAGIATPEVRDELVRSILEREKKGSTGFGKGVAVPHVKHKAVTKMCATIGLSQRGVDFNALDRQPVYTVFLLLSPEDRPEDHLLAMEVIFKNLSNERFRRFLRQSTTQAEVLTLIDEADNQGFVG
jgi:mannitol/fructose-specific phosphotransferase system IIA component (Ntr-type)